ncbi:MAG: lytic murein transglycosylase [Bdellovibrionales bacterium]|nr:lytic murein transglycosylase [Bdellovibrionales bacterium]
MDEVLTLRKGWKNWRLCHRDCGPLVVAWALVCGVLLTSPGSSEADNSVLPYVRTGLEAELPPNSARSVRSLPPEAVAGLKGWGHLYELLTRHGTDHQVAFEILSDERMPQREKLYFSLNPRESKHLYRKHNTPLARQNAVRFYRNHYRYFKEASRVYRVPDSVILAILQVETNCGRYTGQSRTFYRLARLASAATPDNIKANVERSRRKADLAAVRERAEWLEEHFLPHVVSTIRLAEDMKVHPLEVRGSGAGAIGLPQFLPGNVYTFGKDGNGDRTVNLFEPADAIHSIANYLSEHGWDSNRPLTIKDKRQVIWAYNRSDSYIDTVLAMASALEPQLTDVERNLESLFRSLSVKGVIGRRLAEPAKQ